MITHLGEIRILGFNCSLHKVQIFLLPCSHHAMQSGVCRYFKTGEVLNQIWHDKPSQKCNGF